MAVGIPLGPYRLTRRLATGGMAEIFLARREGKEGFARDLVVKRILPHLAADPEFRRMFREEARLAALLSHPNIVHVYDFGSVDSPDGVFIECGHGSGDACQGGTPTCKDANTWQGCKWGKASEVDCFIQCTEIGIDGALFDFGDCQVQDGEAVCACCDEGDEGCEMGA